jgi:LmbE family N-acetylglucosaminyl deacetylase
MNVTITARRTGDILHHLGTLPLRPLADIAPGTALILAPHPDDETLGCGGLIAALCEAGRPPLVICVTDGAASHPGSVSIPPDHLATLRAEELRAACGILGLPANRIHFLGLSDTQAPRHGATFERAARAIASLAKDHLAETIFATWPHDPHGDHEAVAAIATRAAELSQARLTYYPVWGWLLPPDRPFDAPAPTGARFDITTHLPAKRRAIAAHASQYTDLITDSPQGFRLPPALLSVFDQPFETFLDP